MRIATTTGDFAHFLNNDFDRIKELHRAGFRYIDLSMYSFTPDSVYMNDGWQDEVYKLRDLADSLGMKFVQAHSQGGNPLSGVKEKDDFIVDATIRSIEICAMLGIKNTVAHPGFGVGLSKEEWFRRNKEFYSKFFPAMERCGVNLLCENSTYRNTGDMYYTNSGAEMREFIEYVGHPLFHGCWDTGHANCEGNQYDDIMALGDELYAIHYNDNHGDRDEHIVPFFGSLNHDEVICALRDIGFSGYFTLECGATLIKYDQWPIRRRRFEGDSRLRKPQLFMQRGIESLMYDTAKWMLSEYGILEE